MPDFTLSDLGPSDYRRAYTLAVMTGEELSFEDWVADLETRLISKTDHESGVARLLRSDGYLYGLVFYEIIPETRCGTAMEVKRLILPDGLESMKAEVIEMLDHFALAHSCDAVHIGQTLPDRGAPKHIQNLFSDGFQFTPAHWCRRVSKN